MVGRVGLRKDRGRGVSEDGMSGVMRLERRLVKERTLSVVAKNEAVDDPLMSRNGE